jgi:hypothetical protein
MHEFGGASSVTMFIPNFIKIRPAILELKHADRDAQSYLLISCSPSKEYIKRWPPLITVLNIDVFSWMWTEFLNIVMRSLHDMRDMEHTEDWSCLSAFTFQLENRWAVSYEILCGHCR